MDSKDLVIFKKVYELSSFNKAADSIYMTPQGVSKVIQKIEAETNTNLFVRTTKGVKATVGADILYEKASKIIELLDSINTDIVDGVPKEKIHIGISYGILPMFGFDLFDKFNKNNSYIITDYYEDSDVRIEQNINDGVVDMAVIGMPVILDNYATDFLYSCRHVATINKCDPLSEKTSLEYDDLNNKNICLIGRNFNPYHHNIQRFFKHNVHPKSITETSEIAYTHLFASQNKGIGISVDSPSLYNLYENISIIPFSDTAFSWDICIITKKDHIKTPAEQAFSDYIHACCAGIK